MSIYFTNAEQGITWNIMAFAISWFLYQFHVSVLIRTLEAAILCCRLA